MKDLNEYLSLPPLEIVNRIEKAHHEKHAVILAHNYQVLEIQAVADVVGDSLELARAAAKTDAELIVFCGVDFMAESAKILSPFKKVIIPEVNAHCPMAAMVTPSGIKAMRAKYPDAVVLAYVNTSAAVKAESDICCTSANIVEVVRAIGSKKIIFVPDKNLAHYAQRITGADIIPWQGFCYVHDHFTVEDYNRAKALHPNATFIAHPECQPDLIDRANVVTSTSGMIRYICKMPLNEEVILGTEEGLIKRVNQMHPEKKVYPLSDTAVCRQMKSNTLVKTCWAIENEMYEIDLPEEHINKAKLALDRMLAINATT
jgi:quinolinate synthase